MLAPDEVLYTCLPLFHANALFLTTVRALVAGRPMVLARRFSASRLWDDTRRYGATTFNALGAMIPILMKQPVRPDDADNPVRIVFSAACPASVWAEFEERFAVHIIEGYAAVDGGGFAIINFGQSPKGSIGKPMPTGAHRRRRRQRRGHRRHQASCGSRSTTPKPARSSTTRTPRPPALKLQRRLAAHR